MAMARRYREVDIDFEAIGSALERLEPPTLALEEVLAKLRGRLIEKRDQGVTLGELCRTLKDHGVSVGVRALAHFLDTGGLPTRAKANARPGNCESQSEPARESFTRRLNRNDNGGGLAGLPISGGTPSRLFLYHLL